VPAATRANLSVEPFLPIALDDRAAVSEEGERLLVFLAEDAGSRQVRVPIR
jgi:hypothetical protein